MKATDKVAETIGQMAKLHASIERKATEKSHLDVKVRVISSAIPKETDLPRTPLVSLNRIS